MSQINYEHLEHPKLEYNAILISFVVVMLNSARSGTITFPINANTSFTIEGSNIDSPDVLKLLGKKISTLPGVEKNIKPVQKKSVAEGYELDLWTV